MPETTKRVIMSAYNLITSKPLTSERPLTEEIKGKGFLIILRRVCGPKAMELFFSCQPVGLPMDAGKQAKAMYCAIRDILVSEGGGVESIVSETIFMRDMENDIEAVRSVRQNVLAASSDNSVECALTEIQQPPLDESASLEISIQAILSNVSAIQKQQVHAKSGCPCSECTDSQGISIQIEGEARLLAGGLCGAGKDASEQTHSMFELAEKLLHEAGMEFSDVVRTWIYLREMERDYGHLNQARREFFESRGIKPVPASTGIEGGMVSDKHDLCLGIYAVKAGEPPLRTVMTSPTLNEAGEYGADFVRGMKMVETNKVALHVSGTASIDEAGRTAHVDDFEAQVDRMIVNISTLLENQGAHFGDIVSAFSYLKDPANEKRLKEKFKQAGFEGFPNTFVKAEVCRPDLLCETEVFAVLPRVQASANDHEQRHLREAKPVALE